MYLTIKAIHITLLIVSFSLFLIRGILMLLAKKQYRHRLFKIVPPIIDTLLLGSGVSLMVILNQYPTTQSWLAVKLIALIVYIVLGIVALNRVNHRRIQLISFVLAILTLFFMISVALTHHPLGVFSILFS